eukprot:g61120.t1
MKILLGWVLDSEQWLENAATADPLALIGAGVEPTGPPQTKWEWMACPVTALEAGPEATDADPFLPVRFMMEETNKRFAWAIHPVYMVRDKSIKRYN